MNIWFIARNFPPINTIGAERPKKLVRSLTARGHEVTLFTVSTALSHEVFECAGCRVVRSTDWLTVEPGRSRGMAGRVFRRLVDKVLGDQGWSWMLGLSRSMRAQLIQDGAPEMVIATGSPFLTFIVVTIFAGMKKIPLVLDYRDAWSNNPHHKSPVPMLRLLYRWIERTINQRASVITTVSQNTANALLGARDSAVIYNLPDMGYVREISSERRLDKIQSTDGCLVIGYAGTLYPGRDLDVICEAISTISDSRRNRIRFVYCGSSSERARRSFKRFEVENLLLDLGVKSKDDALAVARGCDLMVSIIASTSVSPDDALRGVITTKIFDYFVLGKRFLNLVPPGFEVSSLLTSHGLLGHIDLDPQNVAAIRDVIDELLQRKMDGDDEHFAICEQSECLLEAWEAQMSRLDGLLKSIASSPARDGGVRCP